MSEIRRVAVLTSGGDAPGMNAAIRAVVRTAHHFDLHVYGIYEGYKGMIEGKIKRLENQDVGNILHRGGTILRTARSEEFRTPEGRKTAYNNLKAYDIDAVVVIGGNGTFTGAKIFNEEYPDVVFVGLPGTIDNDIYGTDVTIGFDTSINTAIDAVDKIRDTADSHSRLFFIEVMGRHAGFIALHCGIGSGASAVFLPETSASVEDLERMLTANARRKKLFNLVIVAEGNKNGNAHQIAEEFKKINDSFDVRVAVIGHLQRGGSPTCDDRVIASRLGYASVKALLSGVQNKALGLLNDQVSYTSFEDSISKVKSLNEELVEMTEILSS